MTVRPLLLLLTAAAGLASGPASAVASPADTATTQRYLQADYTLARAARSHLASSERAPVSVVLAQVQHECPLVAEMRHSSWMAEEAIGTFLDYHVGFCNIDQPAYTSAMPPTAFLTSQVGYVRLHGRNPRNSLGGFERPSQGMGQNGTRTRQHDYLYSEAELREWVTRIQHAGRFADRTFVIFNNDAGAKSFVNALEVQAMLKGVRGAAPKELRRRYPVELEHFGPRGAEQQWLFPAEHEAA